METYHTKYRPTTFDAVRGQKEVVQSIIQALDRASCRAFILSGPSGVGKTTLARIIASHVGCLDSNLYEVDAATHTGIDAMRDVCVGLIYRGLGTPQKVMIIDEAHGLSKQAWTSLQKDVEEPPEHVWWVFCTTEPTKIPVAIRNRCLCYSLNTLSKDDIYELLYEVAVNEHLGMLEDIIYAVAEAAEGSPRRALTYLAACVDCKTAKEAHELMSSVVEGGEIIELCRALAKPGLTWERAIKLLGRLDKPNPESIRHVILSYFVKVASSAKTELAAKRALAVLDAFSQPAYHMSSILLSIGQLIYLRGD